ncbi:hypothetical protein PQR25_36800, partial [Paraburkholderia nemoris]|uniref:hypothetical protein n=1 Tax=Paraburkholderia nemoris TaxID=2793076 RepID=UPI0038BCAF63
MHHDGEDKLQGLRNIAVISIPATSVLISAMKQEKSRATYDFNLPDWEDSLQPGRGLAWRDEKGRAHVYGLWYSLLFPFIIVVSLPVFFDALSGSRGFVVPAGGFLLAGICWKLYQWARPKQQLPRFLPSLTEAANVFIVSKSQSLAAISSFPLIFLFVVLERYFPRRHLPLWVIARVT